MTSRMLAFAFTAGALLVGCPRTPEAMDPAAMPSTVQSDYQVFATKCSKCHALSRPLQAAPMSDEQWSMYVARMRRQPGSGISQEDEAAILRFLRYHSDDLRKKRERAAKPAPPPEPAPPPPEPAPAPPSSSPPSPSEVR